MTVLKMASISRYIGLSGDAKPTGVPVGSTFFEYNTKDRYVTHDGTNWVVLAPEETPAGGRYYWVDGTDGLDANSGTSSASPLLTVTEAIDKCIANAGDIINIMANSPSAPPGAETFPIVVDKVGVTIRGTRGTGILSDSGIGANAINTACFEIKASFVTIEDMYLGIDNLGSNGEIVGFNGTNNYWGVTFRRCIFDTQFVSVYGIYLPHDQPYLLVEDCIFGRADIAGYTTAAIYMGNCTGGVIRRNVFSECAGIGISMPASCGNVSVHDNAFYMGLTYSKGDAINTAGSSCMFYNNHAMVTGHRGPQNPFLDTSTGTNTTTKNGWGMNYWGSAVTFPAFT